MLGPKMIKVLFISTSRFYASFSDTFIFTTNSGVVDLGHNFYFVLFELHFSYVLWRMITSRIT